MMHRLVPFLIVPLLTACSSGSNDSASVPSQPKPAPTVIDPQLKALQDAKAVQATMDELERKRRKELDDAGG